jgi:hypothetical protein
MDFVKACIASAIGGADAGEYASHRWGQKTLPARIASQGGLEHFALSRAAVSAGSTVSGGWAELMVDAESAMTEFFSAIRESSLLGRLNFRRVPLRVRLLGLSSGFIAAWTAEGQSKPISRASFSEDSLAPLKVSCATIVTRELLASADPASEELIRQDMVAAVAAAIDESLLNPANAGTAGLEPASLTNGVPSISSSGDGLADMRQLVDAFPGRLETAVLIGSPKTFLALHDPMVLPAIGAAGGNVLGIRAIPSSAAGDTLTLLDPSGVALGIGDVVARSSDQATIEMDDTPAHEATTPTPTTSLVSLWQCGAVGLLTELSANWVAARPCAATIAGIAQS